MYSFLEIWSSHTNSYAHIIKKFNGERVSIFFKNVAIYSRLEFEYYKKTVQIGS